jgi:CubicO group peptidase (beta-lactamase class C family)
LHRKRSQSNKITEFLVGVTAKPAIFHPSYTPGYTNDAFVLLAHVLEKITGASFETLFNESIIEAHGLLRTSFTVPEDTENGVIPGNSTTTSGWDNDLGIFGA